MDSVLFTDHGLVVIAMTTSAIALILSVLGLAQQIGRVLTSSTN